MVAEKYSVITTEIKILKNFLIASPFCSVDIRTLLWFQFYLHNKINSRMNRTGYIYDKIWQILGHDEGAWNHSVWSLWTLPDHRSLLDRLRKNKNVEIYTIDRLCSILHCEIEDIVEHVPEPDERNEHTEKASEKNNPYSEDKKNSLWLWSDAAFLLAVLSVSGRVFLVFL